MRGRPRRVADPPAALELPRVGHPAVDGLGRGQPQQRPSDRAGSERAVGGRRPAQRRELAFDELGVERRVDHGGVVEQPAQESGVGLQPEHRGVGQRPVQTCQRRRTIRCPGDDLRQHRVVGRSDDTALEQRRVHSHALTGRLVQREHGTRRRQEAVVGVLGVDAGLDGMPVRHQVRLRERQRFAGRGAHLELDQVDAPHELGDGVLDLEPGVHLHEEELLGPVRGDDELDGPRVAVPAGPRRGDGLLGHGGTLPVVEQRRRRLLDDLLVSTLQAALALTERDDRSVRVREDLYLDVTGAQHEALDEQRVVTEGTRRLSTGRGRLGEQIGRIVHQAHALAATTRGRLQQDGVADLVGGLGEVRVGQAGFGAAGHHGHTGGRHRGLGTDLVAHQVDRVGRRTDEDEPGVHDGAGELGVLGQEPVAGVDGLRARASGGLEDRRGIEVAARG